MSATYLGAVPVPRTGVMEPKRGNANTHFPPSPEIFGVPDAGRETTRPAQARGSNVGVCLYFLFCSRSSIAGEGRKRSWSFGHEKRSFTVKNSLNPTRKGTKDMTYLKNFLRDEEGQDMVEYALLLAVIALIALAGASALGTQVSTKFSGVSAKLT